MMKLKILLFSIFSIPETPKYFIIICKKSLGSHDRSSGFSKYVSGNIFMTHSMKINADKNHYTDALNFQSCNIRRMQTIPSYEKKMHFFGYPSKNLIARDILELLERALFPLSIV